MLARGRRPLVQRTGTVSPRWVSMSGVGQKTSQPPHVPSGWASPHARGRYHHPWLRSGHCQARPNICPAWNFELNSQASDFRELSCGISLRPSRAYAHDESKPGRMAMRRLWMAIGGALFFAVLAASIRSARRHHSRNVNAGTVSESWLAAHRGVRKDSDV